MAGILVNGQVFSWGTIKFAPFGTPMTGIKEITYDREQEKDNIYGAGVDPIGQGTGRKTLSGSITILLEEWKAIIAASPNRDPLDIPSFPIPVTYGSSPANYSSDTLLAVQFKKDPFTSKEGDTSIWVTVPLLIGAIKR